MMIHVKRGYAASLLAAALAWGAGPAAAQGQVVRLPERDRPLAGTAQQVFAIGRAEGAAHEMFGEVSGVAFDAADNLYVLDRQAKRVMVYDRTGRFLRQIGREGEGPGELMVPMQLVVAGDGTVIVSDLGRRGYSLFRPDGTFIRGVALTGYLPSRGAMAWHPQNGIVGTFREPPPAEMRPGERREWSQATPLLFQPLSGGQPRRVFALPSFDRVQESSSPAGEQRMQFTMRVSSPPAFSPEALYGVLPNGHVALSFTSGYTVRVVDLNGVTLRYLQRPVRTRLTTQADRDRWIAEQRAFIRSGRGMAVVRMGGGRGPAGPSEAQMRQQRERELANTVFADTIPALRALRVAPSGRIWVERTGPVVGEPGPIDLVTPEGQYLGTITGTRLPDAFSRGGRAAYVEEDEDGVQRVIVRQLPAAWR